MSLLFPQLDALPRWKKFTVRYTDFAQAATVFQIALYTLKPMEFVHAVKIIPTTDFSGGLIATYTLAVGGDAGNEVFCVAKDVFTGNTTATDLTSALGVGQGIQNVSGNSFVTIDATSTVADLDQATQGEADVYLLISTLPS